MRYVLSVAFLLIGLTAPRTHAALVYSLNIVGDVSGVRAGAKVPVQLVLTEAGVNDNGQSHSLGEGDGLFGFGIQIAATNGDATLSNLITPGYGPAFGNAANVVTTPQLFALNMTSEAFSTSPFQGENLRQQTIATFDVTYRTTDTLLTVKDIGDGIPLSFGAGFSTAAVAEPRVTFGRLNVTAIPEPTLSIVIPLVVTAMACQRRRRPRVAGLKRIV